MGDAHVFGRGVFKAAFVAGLALATIGQAQPLQAAPHVLSLDAAQTGPVINRDIFGQFAEMLGEGIYGGVWVGRDSKIPNVRGIRTDVVQALRAIRPPVVRWPGGCYADQYHWRDGIGPTASRRPRVNVTWGGVIDPNTFGTDEFMDFADQIGSEAYISVNVGSGTVQEAADWLEYMTTDQPTALGKERAANGRKAPYKVKYVGLGNEAWGCGGAFTPDAYVDRMKLFSQYVQNQNPAQRRSLAFDSDVTMKRIASAQGLGETAYTEAVMKAWKERQPIYWGLEGISLHYYTQSGKFPMMDPSINFGEKDYAALIKTTYGIENMIAEHSAIMDRYDPQKRVAMVIDEWGAWLRPLPGTKLMFLRQQNSLRDAVLASVNLNIFARHADRIRMTNIAQMINVIQSMILTEGPKMVLTPTYYVYKMYVPFQDAQSIPLQLDAGEYRFGDVTVPQVDGIAARSKDGKVWVALTNIDPNRTVEVRAKVQGVPSGHAVGEVLTAATVDAVNTFDVPSTVAPKPFRAEAAGGELTLQLPPKSVTVVSLEP